MQLWRPNDDSNSMNTTSIHKISNMSRNTMNDSKNGREGSDSTIAARAIEQVSF